MFDGASSLNQDLCDWYSNSEVTSATNFCANGAICFQCAGCPYVNFSGDKFQTTSELKSEASTYCSDPSNYNTTKYG